MIVSEANAKKLSRYGWKKCQSVLAYKKRCNATVYDIVTNLSMYDYGFDAPDLIELKKMADLVGFSSDLENIDDFAISLIDFLKSKKIKLWKLNIKADCR